MTEIQQFQIGMNSNKIPDVVKTIPLPCGQVSGTFPKVSSKALLSFLRATRPGLSLCNTRMGTAFHLPQVFIQLVTGTRLDAPGPDPCWWPWVSRHGPAWMEISKLVLLYQQNTSL